ncbi:MAG: phage tail assembly protein [Vallitaleaceae bacterium]|nr:phage tail assembly protein [Vallitaleaceae bacterium]
MSENVKNINEEATGTAKEEAKANESTNIPETKKNATEGENGAYVHKFSRPFEYEGKKLEKLSFNFNKLTGKDMIAIEAEMQAMGEYALAPEISRGFQCRMAAKAGNVGTDLLESMPLPEFNKITNASRDFLISSGY